MIFSIIIGTEILNARREDKHFAFLRDELAKINRTIDGVFMIKDDGFVMKKVFELVKNEPKSFCFCYGGIGATPDDLTRKISAEVFTNGPLQTNLEALELIKAEFGDLAYPHRIKMADIPKGAKLLKNVINNVPGYSLYDRLFFMPGFPQMAHPMTKEAIKKYLKPQKKPFSFNLRAFTRENDLVDFMESLPLQIELSSLPKFHEDGSFSVEINLNSSDENAVKKEAQKLIKILEEKKINYNILQGETNVYR